MYGKGVPQGRGLQHWGQGQSTGIFIALGAMDPGNMGRVMRSGHSRAIRDGMGTGKTLGTPMAQGPGETAGNGPIPEMTADEPGGEKDGGDVVPEETEETAEAGNPRPQKVKDRKKN